MSRSHLIARTSAASAALWLALAFAAAPAARAGLFDDDEARRAILDLRTRLATAEETQKAKLAELTAANAQLTEQMQALRRNLLDQNNQIETLRTELAKLRGADEQRNRELSDLQRRQKDMAQGLDDRVRKIEPQAVSVDGIEFTAEADEKRAYDEALAVMRNGDYDKASGAFGAFLRRYPASGYAPSARFWQGNAAYGRRDYKEAVAAFKALVAASPQHPRVPEALLGLANSQAEMKDLKAARRTLDELVRAYPKSEAAAAAKDRLASLR